MPAARRYGPEVGERCDEDLGLSADDKRADHVGSVGLFDQRGTAPSTVMVSHHTTPAPSCTGRGPARADLQENHAQECQGDNDGAGTRDHRGVGCDLPTCTESDHSRGEACQLGAGQHRWTPRSGQISAAVVDDAISRYELDAEAVLPWEPWPSARTR